MILTVVSGLVLMKRRMMMEVFPPGIRKLWKDWELRTLVFLSLTSQMLLIFLGNRRKYTPKTWIKVVVWSAYLLADAVATMALGVLLNNIGEIYENDGFPDSNGEIAAFWAPFFLLHLGGPDTITAYSLEDNELYLRHAFQLLFQTLTTILIFLMAWNGSRISILAIPMTIVGFIKYGERTWTLWSVSSNQLRESVLSSATANSNYPKFLDEYPLYLAEGYKVERDYMIDAPAFKINMPESGKEFNSDQKIILGDALFHIFKCLFADLSTSDRERVSIEPLLKDMSHKDVFSVIAIELGFMYDLLYTKAIVIHTRWGLIRRVITTCLTSLVLAIFCFLDKQKYSQFDVSLTFLLLGIAIILEIYAALVLFFSDQSRHWFIGRKKINTVLQPMYFLEPMLSLPRWSNSIGQYSFTSLCIKEKSECKIPGLHHMVRLLKKQRSVEKLILQMHQYREKLLEKRLYRTSYTQVTEELQELIFNHVKLEYEQFKENSGSDTNLRKLQELTYNDVKREHDRVNENRGSETNPGELQELIFKHVKKHLDQFKENNRGNLRMTRGSRALEKHTMLKWSVKVDFDESILIWHIASELCYYQDKNSGVFETDQNNGVAEMGMVLSKYMMHLLVQNPLLLPVGVGGVLRGRDTLSEVREYFKKHKISIKHFDPLNQTEQRTTGDNGDDEDKRIPAWTDLLELSIEVKEDAIKSIFYDAHKLASELMKISDKWERVRDVWVEMVSYAASQGRGSEHAHHLRRGGELLSHIWLLMAHFGMTEQYQISQNRGRPALILK